jgi:hypothetical protein
MLSIGKMMISAAKMMPSIAKMMLFVAPTVLCVRRPVHRGTGRTLARAGTCG